MNKLYLSSKWKWFWTCFVGSFLTGALVHAATILLEAYVSTSIFQSDGTTPLPDGSVIQIIGSGDASIDGFPLYGEDCLVSHGTGGDDIILGTTEINSNDLGTAGTFFSSEFTFEYPDIRYVYLRIFDTTGLVTGVVDWAYSEIVRVRPFFGVAEVEWEGGFSTTNSDCFVIIPEPGSGSLMLVFMSLLFGMRYSMRSRKGIQVSLAQNSSLIDDEEKDWL